MIPVKYQVVGEEDYEFLVEIDGSGDFTVHSGTYTSQHPRSGRLSSAQENELLEAIRDMGTPPEHPMPQGASAFKATLDIGSGSDALSYAFWEGALEEDEKLNRLVRLLEMI